MRCGPDGGDGWGAPQRRPLEDLSQVSLLTPRQLDRDRRVVVVVVQCPLHLAR